VTDSQNGAPIIGASVVPKGSTRGTSTDNQGNFSLSVPSNTTALIVSFVGYGQQEIAIRGTNVNISMAPAGSSMNEVVVVGYGTQRKRDVTASISKISSDKIGLVPAPSFESAMAGKAAGVQVTTTSGMAGSGAVIRIRGVNSITVPGDPLYVIDGLPIDVTYLGGPTRNQLGQDRNPLANINPNDIESIEILKDAGAAGIYGSRAANGVVLITTKRGRGKMRHNFSARVGISGPTVEPDFVDKDTWLAIRQEAWELDGNTGPQQFLPGITGGFPLDRAMNNPGTDWWDLATRQGFSHDYNYSVSKGVGKFSFYAGGNYGKEQSYILGNDYQRVGVRVNMDYRPLKNLTFSMNNSFNNGVSSLLNNAWNGGLGLAMSTGLPYYPVYNPDGTYFRTDGFRTTWDFGAGNNTVAQRETSDFRTRESRLINALSAKFTPIKNLDLAGSISYEQNNSLFNSYKGGYYLGRQPLLTSPGNAEDNLNKYKNFSYNFTANYVLELKNDSRITFLAGTEYQDQETIGRYTYIDTALGPLYDGGKTDAIEAKIKAAKKETTFQRLFRSLFARVNYSYKGKYIVQGSIRRDESSTFRENNRFGLFPTVSGAWVVSDENFFPKGGIVDILKVRASYGIMGNAGAPWNAGYASFDTSRAAGTYYSGNPSIFRTRLGNPDLKWETSRNVDVALEATLFDNRINFELGYYRKNSSDLLLEVPISMYNGFDNTQWQNQGSLINEGVEFNMNTVNVKTSNFTWTSNFNIARNYNEITSIGDIKPDALSGGTNETRIVVGYPIGTIFAVRFYGVDPNDGLPIFLDATGKTTKVLNSPFDGRLGDRVPITNTLPKYYGGLTNNFRYKNWELNTVFTYQFGGHIWDNSGKRNMGWITDWNIYSFYVGNYWRKPGDIAKYPRPTIAGYPQSFGTGDPWLHNSSIQVYKSDYVRLRELTINYNLPQKLIKRWKLSQARVFVSGYNLLLFTEYPVGDPETGRDGESDAARNLSANANFLNPPLQRSVNFGLNLSF
ncbi:MAG TPA: SusC/RagA family TonB-linked outer membrane protein, partial [Chitinophagaceae bacterium]|nr:SusC/RagA family TonB-linked outer membrane protein [Chitinophagaceae bacterium]